jgi:bacillithiol synthase
MEQLNILKTSLIPELVKDYIQNNPSVCNLFGGEYDIERALALLKNRPFPKVIREDLVSVLKSQYQGIGLNSSEKVTQNIELLKSEKTFTVTTGQQIHLMLGPVYVALKILTCVGLCRKLSELDPGHNFVPVFWMATEDHDLEEINSIHFFNKQFPWETKQTGACGRMKTEGVPEIVKSILSEFRFDKEDEDFLQNIVEAYSSSKNLADATRKVAHLLFKEYGVVCIDGDDKILKKNFKEVIKEELVSGFSSKTILEKEIKSLGYNPQISGRDTNLFYLTENQRERIDRNDSGFLLSNSGKKFTFEQLLAELDSNPERFSPNVVLRPLYQETILPNLIYVAGPSELVYWSQLKPVFDDASLPYPLVMLRQMGALAGDKAMKKMKSIELELEDWLQTEVVFTSIVKEKLFNLNSLSEYIGELNKFSDSYSDYVYSVNPQKVKEVKKMIKGWEAEIKKFSVSIENDVFKKNESLNEQIIKLRKLLFVGDVPIERLKYWLEVCSNQRNALSEEISTLKSYPLFIA